MSFGALSPGFKYRPRLKVWTDGVNNVFDPVTLEARSYSHWAYLQRINGKVVFNKYRYSQTTANHQHNLKALLKELKIKIDVEVSTVKSLSSLNGDSSSLRYVYEELFEVECKQKTAKKQARFYSEVLKECFDTREKAIEGLKAAIKTLRSLGAEFSRNDIKELKAYVKTGHEKRLANARLESQAQRDKKRALKPVMGDLSAISLEFFTGLDDLNSIELPKNQRA